ncbi:urea carboxylase-associated family protein [Inquilinus sp. OTU3971]|uniref:urea carboxylase-associated family protein n=1 Tax=Inquilinus sp. OTU3971 TaxID=3043855 RepID=UPI00313B04EA
MVERHLVPAAGGAGLRLKRGERLRIIDIEGGQTGDLLAYAPDGSERLSNGRSFDYGGKIYLSTGDVLWSDRSNPMLTIVADEVGRHDFLYAPCSLEMYRMQYGVTGYHPNCHDNLLAALRDLGVDPDPLPTAFNFFMNVEVAADGRLVFAPPRSHAGDAIVLRAEMDLAVALTSCPASTCNAGAPPRPLAFEILAD